MVVVVMVVVFVTPLIFFLELYTEKKRVWQNGQWDQTREEETKTRHFSLPKQNIFLSNTQEGGIAVREKKIKFGCPVRFGLSRTNLSLEKIELDILRLEVSEPKSLSNKKKHDKHCFHARKISVQCCPYLTAPQVSK